MLMKTILALLTMGIVALTRAQGQFEFSADLQLLEPRPPHSERWGGTGTFSLQGSAFSYRVDIVPYGPAPEAAIRGPGGNGPVLFQLALLGCQTDIDTNLGGCGFRGVVTLSDSVIPDLLAENLFVTATYHGFEGDVNYSGRILLVPEPSPIALLSLSALVFGFRIFIRFVLRSHTSAPAVRQKLHSPDACTSA